MRTILIPTDFTVDSLIAVKKTLHINNDDQIKIVLFHCISISDSITDLLTFSRGRLIRELSTQPFNDACEIMRNKFSNLYSIHVEVFTGDTNAAFNNFVEGCDADIICLMDKYGYKMPSKFSRDPLPFVQKSEIPALKIELEVPSSSLSKNQLAVLFSETV